MSDRSMDSSASGAAVLNRDLDSVPRRSWSTVLYNQNRMLNLTGI